MDGNRFALVGVVAALLGSGCGDSASPSLELRAEGRHTALVVHGLLSRISLYSDKLLPVTETWKIDEVVAPLGDRFTFYSPPEIAEEWREQDQNPIEKDGEPLPSVFVHQLESGFSLIQVTEFLRVSIEKVYSDTAGTWREFRNALRETEGDSVTLIDLRNNPGGSVAICLAMADELVPEGRVLIASENHASPWSGEPLFQTTVSTAGGLGENRRFLFLANNWSASCAELMLAAVRGNRDDRFVGTTTYGKGIGQSLWTLPDGGMLRATSLRFWGPDGGSWHGEGLHPDVVVEERGAQLSVALAEAHQMAGRPPLLRELDDLEEKLWGQSAAGVGRSARADAPREFEARSSEELLPLDSLLAAGVR